MFHGVHKPQRNGGTCRRDIGISRPESLSPWPSATLSCKGSHFRTSGLQRSALHAFKTWRRSNLGGVGKYSDPWEQKLKSRAQLLAFSSSGFSSSRTTGACPFLASKGRSFLDCFRAKTVDNGFSTAHSSGSFLSLGTCCKWQIWKGHNI